MTEKDRMNVLIDTQPVDPSYEEIMLEPAFECMVDRGLKDVRRGGGEIRNEATCAVLGGKAIRWRATHSSTVVPASLSMHRSSLGERSSCRPL
jgi:hypothetical protein